MSDPSRYPVPAGVHRVEERVRRSRFVTTAARASDPEGAHDVIRVVQDELPDATHHCWAFVAGPPGSTTHVGMSDAGEPSGTAGRPMLNALLHGGVGEIVTVCTRYFGGVKLGTGGLARAYASGVKLALASLPVHERVVRARWVVTLSYPAVDAFQRLTAASDVVIHETDFGGEARFTCDVPAEGVAAFHAAVADLSGGRGRLEEVVE